MNSEEIDKIDEEIKKLYKSRDKAIEKEFGSRVGNCYHPPGLDVYVFIKTIKGKNVEVIEINNGAIWQGQRNYQDQIFDETYKEKTAKFKARLKSIVDQIEEEMKK